MFPILLSVVVTQFVLWTSYYFFFNQNNVNFELLWGNTPQNFRTYLLISAAVAYAMNLFLLVRLAMMDNLDQPEQWLVIACVCSYYIAQLFFLPLTNLAVKKQIPKCVVTTLLVLCVIPFVVLTGVVTKHSNDAVNLIFSFLPLLHVAINDAIIFGFLF